jgi:hypothetical protein
MRIKAYVSERNGETKHYSGIINKDKEASFEEISSPKWLEISGELSGFYLYRLNSNGECIADTWHENLDSAKAQAKFEFGVLDDEWETVPKKKEIMDKEIIEK